MIDDIQYLQVADKFFIASIYSDIYKKNIYGVEIQKSIYNLGIKLKIN